MRLLIVVVLFYSNVLFAMNFLLTNMSLRSKLTEAQEMLKRWNFPSESTQNLVEYIETNYRLQISASNPHVANNNQFKTPLHHPIPLRLKNDEHNLQLYHTMIAKIKR